MQGLQFEWTVNIGHVITGLTALLAIYLLWSRTQTDVKLIKEWIGKHEEAVEDQVNLFRSAQDNITRLTILQEVMDKRLAKLEGERA